MVFSPFMASSATFALKSLLYFFGELAIGFLLGNASLLPAIVSHDPVQFPGTSIQLDREIEEETTVEALNDLSRKERNARLFLDAYKDKGPYGKFVLFKVPVLAADD
jgi:hypothetical protein